MLWLDFTAYACSMEVCEQKGPWKATRARSSIPPYVSYCMHRVKLLQFNNITPVVVFDGGYLPLKAATEDDRRRCFSKLFNLLCFLLLPHASLA